jgi:hypothetical protein
LVEYRNSKRKGIGGDVRTVNGDAVLVVVECPEFNIKTIVKSSEATTVSALVSSR